MRFSTPRLLIATAFAVLALVIAAEAFLALRVLRTPSASIEPGHRDPVVCRQLLHVVGTSYGVDITRAVVQARDGTLTRARAAQIVAWRDVTAMRTWDAYLRIRPTLHEVELIAAAQSAVDNAHRAALEVQRLLGANDARGLDAFAAQVMPAAFEAMSSAIDKLVKLQKDV